MHQTQRKGAMSPKETEPKLHSSVAGPPVEAWVGMDLPLEHWKVPFGINYPLGVIPTIIEPMAGLLRPTTREGVQLHPSACNWIKALLNKVLPTKQGPVFPIPPIKKLTQAS